MWKAIASYGLKRDDVPEEYAWKKLGSLMYNEDDHSCAIVTDIISFGQFYAKPYDNIEMPPFLDGSICVFNREFESEGVMKKKYDDLGHILTHSDAHGEVSYQINIWGVSIVAFLEKLKRVTEGDKFTGMWQNIHLTDRDAYQAERFKPEDEDQSKPVTQWKPAEPEMKEPEYEEDNLPF